MSKNLRRGFRDNVVVLSLILAIIFAGMNVILYIINQSYLEQKIESENNAFLQLTTHLINENDISVALEYVEHYTHIHAVEIEVTDENDIMLFSSSISYRYSREYQIDTLQGTYTIYMDNTESTTVISAKENFLYVNITLFVIYIIAVGLLYYINKNNTKHIEQDLYQVLQKINQETIHSSLFHFDEFHMIHQSISAYIEKIDLLQDQKDTNIKGLAHDIKTPLTILYEYINTISQGQIPNNQETKNATLSAHRINDLLDDLIQDNYYQNKQSISLKTIIQETIEAISDVYHTKNLTIETTLDDFNIEWNKRDFKRIIENILSNAYHYSKLGTTVKVTLHQEETIECKITSTPIDMSSVNVNNIFEKGVTSTNQDSKGLGLYICKLLLLSVNGKITASTNKNEFIITIHI